MKQWLFLSKIPLSYWGLGLIFTAFLGVIISYYVTVESRLAFLEQTVDQNSRLLQDDQAILHRLDQQLAALPTNSSGVISAPDQTLALADLRGQVALLQAEQLELRAMTQKSGLTPMDAAPKASKTSPSDMRKDKPQKSVITTIVVPPRSTSAPVAAAHTTLEALPELPSPGSAANN